MKSSFATIHFSIFVALFCVPYPGFASREFMVPPGDNALMLGGAFSATANDASGIYYNPAGLGSVKETRLSGSTQGYGRTISKYNVDGLGLYKQKSEGVLPGLLGGVSKPKWNDQWSIGFAVITLDNMVVRQDDEYPNAKLVGSSTLNYVNRMSLESSNTWLGIGAGRELFQSDLRIGWSISTEIRSTHMTQEERAEFKNDNELHASFLQYSQRRTESSRVIGFTLGIQYDMTPDLSLGMSVAAHNVVKGETEGLYYSHADGRTPDPSTGRTSVENQKENKSNHVHWGQAPWYIRTGAKWQAGPKRMFALDTNYMSPSRQSPIEDDTRGVTNVSMGWQELWLPFFSSGIGIFTNLDQEPPTTATSNSTNSQDYYAGSISGQIRLDDTRYTLSIIQQESRSKHKLTNDRGVRPLQKSRSLSQQIMIGISSGW